MNQKLVNVFSWIIGTIFSVLNMLTGDNPGAWAVIAAISVYNAFRQYKLYQKEREI